MWGRGVDTQRGSAPRPAATAPPGPRAGGEVLAGIGRLAPEKQVELLAGVAVLPGVRLVIVGGGPAEPRLRRLMPSAVFLGQHRGEQLARIFASLDVFVHSGCHETFGQTIQEAAASACRGGGPGLGWPGRPRPRRGHRDLVPSRDSGRADRRRPAAGRRPAEAGRDGPGGPAAGAGAQLGRRWETS